MFFTTFKPTFIWKGAGAGEQKYLEPEPVKRGPASQHWVGVGAGAGAGAEICLEPEPEPEI